MAKCKALMGSAVKGLTALAFLLCCEVQRRIGFLVMPLSIRGFSEVTNVIRRPTNCK